MEPVAGPWRKSSYSNGAQNCVEIASLSCAAAVRDSKNPDGPALVFRPDAFTAFLGAVKAGRLDL